MKKRKKWEIANLDGVRELQEGACLILSSRLLDVIELAGQFRRSDDAEDLHQLRIAIRRLRYPLETYLSLFRRKVILRFIGELNALQDAAGHARDMDIMIMRLERDRDAHGWRIARRAFTDLAAERIVLYRLAVDAIDLFLVSPVLYDFKSEIGFRKHVERLGDAGGEPSESESGHAHENNTDYTSEGTPT